MSSLPASPVNETRSSSAETSPQGSQILRSEDFVDQVVDHANRIIQGQGREVESIVPSSGLFDRAHDFDLHGGSYMSAAGNINIYNGPPPRSTPPVD
ncbi:hypothetical protein CPC08DRAFT_124482 [Agrocybe pediades]|nr:hypothetical protein CPC08DRAFT_124482 [Agrocybe pediades]